jgi:hypothetical protein
VNLERRVFMAVTTKLSDEANALLEIYLGWRRARLERIDKEDAVAEFVSAGVRAAMPLEVLDLLTKDTPLIQARPIRIRARSVESKSSDLRLVPKQRAV